MFLGVHGDDAGVAVGLAGMVDEARGVAVDRRVDHLVVVDAKHVAADSLRGREKTGGGVVVGRTRLSEGVAWNLQGKLMEPHLSIVILLPLVGEHGSNDISGIFNDHFASLNGFLTEQTSAMDRRSAGGCILQSISL